MPSDSDSSCLVKDILIYLAYRPTDWVIVQVFDWLKLLWVPFLDSHYSPLLPHPASSSSLNEERRQRAKAASLEGVNVLILV